MQGACRARPRCLCPPPPALRVGVGWEGMEWEVPGKSEPHTGTGLLQSPQANIRHTMESSSGGVDT